MSFFKRSLMSIWQRKGRTSLFLGLFFIVFLLILAGFAIQESAEKSKVDARKQLGAEVRLKTDDDKLTQLVLSGKTTMEPLTKEIVEQMSHLPQVKNSSISGTVNMAKSDLESVTPENESEMTLSPPPGYEMPAFEIKGTNNMTKTTDFMNHDAKIIEGEPINDKSAKNSAVVEETFAKNNHFKIGDTFTLRGVSKEEQEKEYRLKIVGIYKSEKVLAEFEKMFAASQPENQIFVDLETFLTMGKQARISDATFYLNDPLKVEEFVKEAETKLPTEDNIFKLDAHTDQYEQMIGPLEKMSAFSSIMIKIIVVAGGLILTFLSLLSIRDRKKEVGILLALGENKGKVILQLVTEIILIGIVAFGLSFAVVGTSGQTISNVMLSQQVEKVESTLQEDEYGQEDSSIEPVDKMNLTIDKNVVSKAAALGFLLIVLTTLIPSMMIAKTDPKDLFAQKE